MNCRAENFYNCFVGKADKNLCEAILNELRQAVVKTTADPIRSVKQKLFLHLKCTMVDTNILLHKSSMDDYEKFPILVFFD